LKEHCRTAGVTRPNAIAAEPFDAERRSSAAVSPGEIARLAHSFWEARGRTDGSAVEDWLRAERELLALSRAASWGESTGDSNA
jgi:hypothetical protein